MTFELYQVLPALLIIAVAAFWLGGHVEHELLKKDGALRPHAKTSRLSYDEIIAKCKDDGIPIERRES